MINWNKYQSRVSGQAQNQYLRYLIDPNFQEVSMLLMLSFKNNTGRTRHAGHCFPTVGIKDYSVMINLFFDQPVTNEIRTY